jgi:hypothetical protein
MLVFQERMALSRFVEKTASMVAFSGRMTLRFASGPVGEMVDEWASEILRLPTSLRTFRMQACTSTKSLINPVLLKSV